MQVRELQPVACGSRPSSKQAVVWSRKVRMSLKLARQMAAVSHITFQFKIHNRRPGVPACKYGSSFPLNVALAQAATKQATLQTLPYLRVNSSSLVSPCNWLPLRPSSPLQTTNKCAQRLHLAASMSTCCALQTVLQPACCAWLLWVEQNKTTILQQACYVAWQHAYNCCTVANHCSSVARLNTAAQHQHCYKHAMLHVQHSFYTDT